MLVNPKQIPDPENEGQMIDNPDYDPTKNEDGSPIEDVSDSQKALDKAKADFKKKMDDLNARVKQAEEKAAALEKAEREREANRLRDEGKLAEAYALEKTALESELTSLRESNVRLSRDRDVRDAVSSVDVEFRTPKAKQAAVNEITSELIKGDDGVWKAKDGRSVEDYVKAFLEHDDNSYLLKPKRNSGGGSQPIKPSGKPENKPGSIFEMGFDQIAANILAGKPARG
jgi:hypothetical protein